MELPEYGGGMENLSPPCPGGMVLGRFRGGGMVSKNGRKSNLKGKSQNYSVGGDGFGNPKSYSAPKCKWRFRKSGAARHCFVFKNCFEQVSGNPSLARKESEVPEVTPDLSLFLRLSW